MFNRQEGKIIGKRSGCLVTSLKTPSVHFEMTYSLSTDSFIMTLLRFIERREEPSEICCDSGLNFVGAVSELREIVQQLNLPKISSDL